MRGRARSLAARTHTARKVHLKCDTPEHARLLEPISTEKIDSLYDYYSRHLNVKKPEWEIMPFEYGNPDPLYAEYCGYDAAAYCKNSGRIEFYVQPDMELAMHEFMHHVASEKLWQLLVLIEPELDLRQLQLLKGYVERLGPGVDLDDPIEQMKLLRAREVRARALPCC